MSGWWWNERTGWWWRDPRTGWWQHWQSGQWFPPGQLPQTETELRVSIIERLQKVVANITYTINEMNELFAELEMADLFIRSLKTTPIRPPQPQLNASGRPVLRLVEEENDVAS